MTKTYAVELSKRYMKITKSIEKRKEVAKSRKIAISGKVYIIRKGKSNE